MQKSVLLSSGVPCLLRQLVGTSSIQSSNDLKQIQMYSLHTLQLSLLGSLGAYSPEKFEIIVLNQIW